MRYVLGAGVGDPEPSHPAGATSEIAPWRVARRFRQVSCQNARKLQLVVSGGQAEITASSGLARNLTEPLDPQHALAVDGIVVGEPLDQSGQRFAIRSGGRAGHAGSPAGRPRRNGTIARCFIRQWPSGIMSLLMRSLYSVPTYHTMLIEPRHAFRVFPHTSPLRYQRPSHREMVQSDQGLRFRLTG
jgi:hypothetical protein